MIVTRRRKPRPHYGRYLVPLAVIAAIGFLMGWPPSQRVIANGPLRPLWQAGSGATASVARPLTFAGQQQTIAERNREIRDLADRLERQRQAKVAADARAQQLAQQVTALANQPHAAPLAAAPRPVPTAAAFGTASAGTGVTPDEKRLAATWSSMEPERAAAVAQKMPVDAVVRILGAMDADSAGAIMNALPTTTAARISRAVAQVQPVSGR